MTQRTLAYADQQERDGRDLRARREELSLTQREVAALVGVSNVAISLLERGYASQAMRRRVREALDTYTAEPADAVR